MSITTSKFRLGMSNDEANNFDLEPDGAGSLLIKQASTGLTVGKIDAGGNLLGRVPVFRVHRSAAQTIFAGTQTLIQFDALSAGIPNGGYSENVFKPSVPGVYRVSATVGVQTPISRFFTTLYKNGVEAARGTDSAAPLGTYASTAATEFYLNGTTDFISVYCYADVQATVGGNPTIAYFSGHLVSADL